MTLAANEFGEPGLGGWWTGIILGFIVVVVVVVIVGILLTLAARIGGQAVEAVGLLEDTREGTAPLAELTRTNDLLTSILRGAATARQALGG